MDAYILAVLAIRKLSQKPAREMMGSDVYSREHVQPVRTASGENKSRLCRLRILIQTALGERTPNAADQTPRAGLVQDNHYEL